MAYVKINENEPLLLNKIKKELENNDNLDINKIFYNITKAIDNFLNSNKDTEKIDKYKRRIDTALIIIKLFKRDIFYNINPNCFLKLIFDKKCLENKESIAFWTLKSDHVLKYKSLNFPIVLYNTINNIYCHEQDKKENTTDILYFQNIEEFNEPEYKYIIEDKTDQILQKIIIIYECMQYNFYSVNPIYQSLNSNIDIKKIIQIKDLYLNINIKKLIILSPKTIFINNDLAILHTFKDYMYSFLSQTEREYILYNDYEGLYDIIFKSFSNKININYYPFKSMQQMANFNNCSKIFLKDGYLFKYETSLLFILNTNETHIECAIINENINKKDSLITKTVYKISDIEGKIYKFNDVLYSSSDYIKLY